MKNILLFIFSILFILLLPEQIRHEDIENYYTIWGSSFSFSELQLKEQIEIISRLWFYITGHFNFFMFQLINIFIISALIIKVRENFFEYEGISKYLILFTPSTFVILAYTWRQGFAFLFFTLAWYLYNAKPKYIFYFISCAIHSSSIIFFLVNFISMIKNRILYFILLLIFLIILIIFYFKFPYFIGIRGDMNSFAFIGWVIYSIISILFYLIYTRKSIKSIFVIIPDIYTCLVITSIATISSPVIISRFLFPLQLFISSPLTNNGKIFYRIISVLNIILFLRLFF